MCHSTFFHYSIYCSLPWHCWYGHFLIQLSVTPLPQCILCTSTANKHSLFYSIHFSLTHTHTHTPSTHCLWFTKWLNTHVSTAITKMWNNTIKQSGITFSYTRGHD
jgi:hypothetical protein